MNELIIKRACAFSLILGSLIGLFALIPSLASISVFFVSFLASPIVLVYMKRNEKHLGIIDNQQSAILGGIIGFCCSIGFFAVFCPMVLVIHKIFAKYYSYGIPYIIQDAFWLFLVIVFMISLILAATNATCAMGVSYVYSKFETKPKDFDAPVDIEIND